MKLFSSTCVYLDGWIYPNMNICKHLMTSPVDVMLIAFSYGAHRGHFLIVQVHTPYLLDLPLTHYSSLISDPGCNHDRKFLFA